MSVIIQDFTYKYPIQMIGAEAGVCYGSDITDKDKNYKRGIDCLENQHGRTWEFPDVYMVLDEYSARVFREWYTHIGGAPTRLQASTRYIDYQKGFDYFTTTLTISPLKNAEKLNEIGNKLADKYGIAYLPSDFKKKNGYKRSIELSREYGLYRQDYCGCEFSQRERMNRE